MSKYVKKGDPRLHQSEWNNMWYGSRRASNLARSKRHYEAHKHVYLARAGQARTFRKTGWTREAYDAAFERQAGNCYICAGRDEPIRLAPDHCHATGKLGKLLCRRCNVALGYIEHPMRPRWEAYLAEVR